MGRVRALAGGSVMVVALLVAMVLLASPASAGVEPPIVDVELTPSETGYWIVDERGGITAVNAPFLGDRPSLQAGERIVSMTPTADGGGYWLFTSRGRVITYGNAPHHGDMSGVVLNGPVISSIPTSDGGGYYMVAEDGGIFSFGNASFFGSMGGQHLNQPVNGLAPTADGLGYWLVASDGGIFAFGSAGFYGSMGGTPLNEPVVGMIGQDNGYMMLASDGGIFNFGQSQFHGSLGGTPINRPIAAAASKRDLSGYLMVSSAGTLYRFGATPATGWPSYPEPGFGAVGSGTHVVGTGIAPGAYRVIPEAGRSCYWARLSGFGGSTGDVIANEFASYSTLVEVSAGDAGFELSSGCWLATSDLSPVTSSPTASFGAGQYLVHRDVRPGTWQSSGGSGSCYWERRRDLSGRTSGVIANGFASGPQAVTIDDTDLSFLASVNCGSWTRIA